MVALAFRVIKYNYDFVEVEVCGISEIVSHLSDALNRGLGFCCVEIK